MKAIIKKEFVMDGRYLNEVGQTFTWFVVPKGQCDVEMFRAVQAGVLHCVKPSGNPEQWLVAANTNEVEWEE